MPQATCHAALTALRKQPAVAPSGIVPKMNRVVALHL